MAGPDIWADISISNCGESDYHKIDSIEHIELGARTGSLYMLDATYSEEKNKTKQYIHIAYKTRSSDRGDPSYKCLSTFLGGLDILGRFLDIFLQQVITF